MNEEWTNDATTWCKWYVTRPHTQRYVYQVYNGEGNLDGMVRSCLSYIWEHDDPHKGINAYHVYLQQQYGYTADGVRNNPSRIGALTEDLMGRNENIDPAELVAGAKAAPPDDSFEESQWCLPSLRGISTTYKGRTPLNEGPRRQSMTEWLESLPELEQDILSTYADVGRAETSRLLGVQVKKVDYTIDKVRRAVARAVPV